MRDERTKYEGQGSPYETRPEASPYFHRAPKPSRQEARSARISLVKKWEPIFADYENLSDAILLSYYIMLYEDVTRHNANYPDDAIIIKQSKNKPILIYSED